MNRNTSNATGKISLIAMQAYSYYGYYYFSRFGWKSYAANNA
ncbi:hypothetical protein [Treponema sp.]|nr:hypothetical protein [Treponema sp.]